MKKAKHKIFKRQKDLIKFACAKTIQRCDNARKSFIEKRKKHIENHKRKNFLRYAEAILRGGK